MALNDAKSSINDDNPVVGITSYLEQAQTGVWDVPASFLPQVYLAGLTQSGALATVLTPQPLGPGQAAALLDRLDGLVLSGGADVDPALYGASAHEATDQPRTDRDAFELALLREALQRGMPVLGICRGAQVLNVALGGTLHQHLPDLVECDDYRPGGGVFGSGEVIIEPGSRTGSILGDRLEVPLYHHQAIDALGAGLIVSARSQHDIIQAVELPETPFVVAVQWHPEEDLADRRLFDGFVAAAKQYRRNLEPPA